jgi:hypothetical protein
LEEELSQWKFSYLHTVATPDNFTSMVLFIICFIDQVENTAGHLLADLFSVIGWYRYLKYYLDSPPQRGSGFSATTHESFSAPQ